MQKLLCPSMMCANYGALRQEIEELEAAGIDLFHIDVMDGKFVPNFGMGLQDIQHIGKTGKKPMDAHLMIENPGQYVELFAGLGAKIIYIHPEADVHPTRTLQKIIDCGAQPGIAINPGTSVSSIEELLPLVDYILVMTVNPGFAGQKYLEFTDGKIRKLLEMQKNYHYELVVDGAISPEKIQSLSQKGVKGFVLGTSALFGKDKSYKELICALRAL
ncbi:MAG: ribulose-phosphate 3-epimerase [Oscillospiraceae bacterium]